MFLTKDDVLSAILGDKGFEIVDADKNTDEKVLVKWKGFIFYISFNNELASKINSDDEEDMIYSTLASDFTLTFAARLNLGDVDVIDRYRVINHWNFNSYLGATYIYRESADLVEIRVSHSVYMKEEGASQIIGSVMKMVLTGVMAITEIEAIATQYSKNPDDFEKIFKGVSA